MPNQSSKDDQFSDSDLSSVQAIPATAIRSIRVTEQHKAGIEGRLGEVTYLLAGLCSLAAALSVLWRASNVAFSPQAIVGDYLWLILGFSAVSIAAFTWISFLFLRNGKELEAQHRLIRMIEQLDASPLSKVEMLGEVTGRVTRDLSYLSGLDERSKRALAAGEWVLERFDEGAVVISLAEPLANPEKLRDALGAKDPPLQMLRPGSESSRHHE